MLGKVEGRKEEFIEYANKHTLEETTEHFGIQKSYAQRLRREWCGIVTPGREAKINKAEFIAFKKKHGYKEAAKHFNISVTTAYNYCVKWGLVCYRTSEEDYIFNGHNIKEEFPEYAKTHTANQCAEHFGVSRSALRWWCERYKVEPQRKKRTLKEVARLLYILDDGNKLYYFTNLDDIAQFVGLTRTRVNMLIIQESKIHQYLVRKERITSYRFQADKPRKCRNVQLDN